MEKKLHKTPNKVKTVLHKPKSANTKTVKRPVVTGNKDGDERDEDELVHEQPEDISMINNEEKDLDDVIHDRSGFIPGEDDGEDYFDDDDINGPAYKR